MTDGPLPACYDRLSGGSFTEPTERQLASLDSCGYCFPEAEIDLEKDDLLVGQSPDNRGRLHRHERTGDLQWEHNTGPKLAYALQDAEVTDPADIDWSEIRGGDA